MGDEMIQNKQFGRVPKKHSGAEKIIFVGILAIACFWENHAWAQETQSNSRTKAELGKKVPAQTTNTQGKVTPLKGKPPKPTTDQIKLFNGRDLAGLKVLEKGYFDGHGKISVKDGALIIDKGMPGSGIAIDPKVFKDLPKMDYEITFDAMRIEGDDFFCGLTFPVNESFCTLILGGWGGGAIGLSNVDTMSAIENETSTFEEFENNVWYNVRLRVTGETISATLRNKKAKKQKELFSIETEDHKFDIWWEQEPARPLGFTTWSTKAAIQNIELKPIPKKK